VIGRRVTDETEPHLYIPGDYGRWRKQWYCLPVAGALGSLRGHQVEEHADGTITVSPSILVTKPGAVELFHGWLRAGVWTVA
jgi:hypothetical protein